MPSPQAPVQMEVLYQEGRDYHARSVVHPGFSAKLAHARVDERVARAALRPGRKELVVATPLDGPRFGPKRLPGTFGPVGKDGCVELPPGQFADKALGPFV